jgi:hypothetical protein
MFQTIGAYLDCMLFIGFGLFCLLAPTSNVRQDGTPEEVKKRIKIFRIAGAVALIAGIGLLGFRISTLIE